MTSQRRLGHAIGELDLDGRYGMGVTRITRADIEMTGLLAGSTTNPPALAFATNVTGSDSPTLAYATVYPLTMLLRILGVQVLALTLAQDRFEVASETLRTSGPGRRATVYPLRRSRARAQATQTLFPAE